MKLMKKYISLLAATTCTLSLLTTSTTNVTASSKESMYIAQKGEVSKEKFKQNKRFEVTVTTTKNEKIKLVFKNNKIYYTDLIYEAAWDYKLAKNLTIKLDGNKKIKIKNGKFYSNDKLYTGQIRTEDTLVRPLSGKAYFYLNGTIKKGVLVKGVEYMIDYNSTWAG